MWTSQVYGHHDKMARTKTHRTSQNTEYTKTQQTLRNNFFCVFGFFWVFFSIFNYLKDFSKTCLITALVRLKKHWGWIILLIKEGSCQLFHLNPLDLQNVSHISATSAAIFTRL